MSWFKDKYGEDAHPILPIDLFEELYNLWHGDEEAVANIVMKVQDGELSVEDVRRRLNRSDISPDKWQDFEDGWRPDDWDN